MRKKLLYIIFFLFNTLLSQAQESRYDAWWNNISIANKNEKPYQTDTMLVMYSTRVLDESKKNIFSHEINPDGKVNILLAICKNEQWKIFRMPNLDSAMYYMNNKADLVFYIEGLGKNFPIAMYRAAGLTTQYNVNVIMLDYPTLNESKGLIKNFYFAAKSSKNTAKQFSAFLATIQSYDKDGKVWLSSKNKTLFIHSMGNVMIKEAVSKKLLTSLNSSFIDLLVLNAPCVSQRKHAQWVDSISFAKKIYIHHNPKDLQLLGARMLTHRLTLGANSRKPFSKKATYVNLVKVLGKQHNGYLNKPGAITVPQPSTEYYSKIFHGETIDWSDSTIFQQTKFANQFYLR